MVLNPLQRLAALLFCLLLLFSADLAGATDTDGDGLSDSDEITLGYDPNTPDLFGATAGSFEVDQGGGANYSVPIVVPPGTLGMQPELGLSYSSQTPNGLLGVGWSLDGLSAISRCPPNQAQDGLIDAVDFDANDRFCLDGSRLVAIQGSYGADGTEYRTEIDGFSRIVSYGSAGAGPQWFRVWEKGGRILDYGSTADSRIEAQGRSDVRIWALGRVSDRMGNYYTVSYIEDAPKSSFYPSRIDYTGNDPASLTPYASVRFEYEARPDVFTAYTGGSLEKTDQRLSRVTTHFGETLVREYPLTYVLSAATGSSLLSQIQECGDSSQCLPATGFSWGGQESLPGQGQAWVPSASFAVPYPVHDALSTSPELTSQYVDLDGDGLSDFVVSFRFSDGQTTWMQSYLNTGSGWVSAPEYQTPYPVYDNLSTTPNQTSEFVDLNGDGLVDFVVSFRFQDGQTWVNQAYLNTGSGWASAPGYQTPYPIHDALSATPDRTSEFVDLNGDGLVDFVVSIRFSDGQTMWMQSYLNTGSGWTSAPAYQTPYPMNDNLATNPGRTSDFADLNGDGLPDFIVSFRFQDGQTWVNEAYLNTGSGWSPTTPAYRTPYPIYDALSTTPLRTSDLVDLNGDGLVDFVVSIRFSDGQTMWMQSYLNTGSGWTSAPGYQTPYPMNDNLASNPDRTSDFVDLNGDGLPDFVVSFRFSDGQTMWMHSYLNTGSGWSPSSPAYRTPYPIHDNLTTNPAQTSDFVDLNGDGIADFAVSFRFSDGQTWVNNAYTSTARSTPIDAMVEIVDGLGATTSIEYAPLTSSAVYTKGTGVIHPQVDLQIPNWVVREAGTPDGIGGQRTTQYRYAGMRYDIHRRTGLGFASREEIDPIQESRTIATFSQSHPIQGQIETIEVRDLVTDVLLTRTLNAWEVRSDASGSYHAVLPAQTVEERYEIDGVFASSTTVSRQFDDYGNVLSELKQTNDGHTSEVVTQYQNDAARWLLGQPLREETHAISPGYAEQVRTTEYVYLDPNLPLVHKRIVEPDLPALRVETEFSYDPIGNPNSITLTGPSFSDRTATSTYDVTGRFKISSTNELGHVEFRSYDSLHGGAVLIQGPNSSAPPATMAYDSLGRHIYTVTPEGVRTRTTRTPCVQCPGAAVFRVSSETDGQGPKVGYFDVLGREVRREAVGFDGRRIFVDTEYDALGRVFRSSRPYYEGEAAYWTTFSYDFFDRVLSEIDPDGSVTTLVYGPNTLEVTNDRGHTKREVRNSLGLLVEVTDALGGVQNYEYDPFGNVVRAVDPVGNEVIATFDVQGRRTSLLDPDLGYWIYSYNALGELISQTDAKGQTTTLSYDALSRPIQRTEPEGVTTWEYDTATNGIGALARVTGTDLGYERVLTYDSFGRISSTTTTIEGESFTTQTSYDSLGRVDTFTYPSGFATRRRYTALGYQDAVENAATGQIYWEAVAMNADGQVTDESLGDYLATQRYFDSATGRLEQIITASGTELIQDLSYVWDSVGNLTRRSDQRQGLYEDATYDALNRLITVSLAGAGTTSLTYDAVGNLTFKTGVGNYVYGENGAGPHAVTYTSEGNVSYSYDLNGNMTGSSVGRSIAYTSFNKAAYIEQPKGGELHTITNWYGPDRELIRRRETTGDPAETAEKALIGNLYEKVVEADGDIEQKHYIPGATGAIAVYTMHSSGPAQLRYLHRDHLGSIDTITDELGMVVERLSYDPHGKRRQANWTADPTGTLTSSVDQGFTGHRHLDKVGLIDMKARLYDPVLGRFLSPDPMVQFPDSTQGYNRYTYVNNNPLSFVDPSGFGLKRYLKKARKWVQRVVRKVSEAFVKLTDSGILGVALNFFLPGSYRLFGVLAHTALKKYNPVYLAAKSIAAGGSITESVKGLAKLFGTLVVSVGAMVIAPHSAPWVATNLFGEALKTASLAVKLASHVIGGAAVGAASSALTAAINGENIAEAARKGAISGAVSGLLNFAAREMRAFEVAGSKQLEANRTGKSRGFFGDFFKLAGGRQPDPNPKAFLEFLGGSGESFLGGHQGGVGKFFGLEYSPGGLVDYVLEAYAGPHDFLNHPIFYAADGSLKLLNPVVRELGPLINFANLAPATPFAAASILPAGPPPLDFSSYRDLR